MEKILRNQNGQEIKTNSKLQIAKLKLKGFRVVATLDYTIKKGKKK